MLETIIFWAFALMAVVSAVGVVLQKSIIYSALQLIVVFLSIAGIFILNNADFLAIAQTIVYAVGLTIVLLFGIMFTGDRPTAERFPKLPRLIVASSVVMFTLIVILKTTTFPFKITAIPPEVVAVIKAQGTTGMLGETLFSTYALPFELASVLLLLAMIGAIILSKKHYTTVEDSMGQTMFSASPDSKVVPEAEGWRKTLDDNPPDIEFAETEPVEKEVVQSGV